MATLHSMIEGIFDAFDPPAATYGAMLLTIVVGVVHLAFHRWLTAGQLAVLWGLVLLRLAIPIAPASSWSLQTLVEVVASAADSGSELSRSSAPTRAVTNDSGTAAVDGVSNLRAEQRLTASESHEASFNPDFVFQWTLFAWFVVGFGGLAITVASHWKFGRRIARLGQVDDRLTALWESCRAEIGFSGKCRPVVFDEIETPAVTGLFRSTVVVPPRAMELADEQLRMILLHELAHLQRRDLAANWLLVLLRAVHWWNPIYWLAARRFRMLCEQACDGRVVRTAGPGAIGRYGELLLELAKSRPVGWWQIKTSAAPLGIAIASPRVHEIRGRLRALGRENTERGRRQRLAALAMLLMVAVCGLTDARVPDRPREISSWMAEPVISVDRMKSYVRPPAETGQREQRSYEIGPVLMQLAEPERSEGQTRIKFESLLKLLFPAPAATCAVEGSTLYVDAPTSVHERLAGTLDAWVESGMNQIVVRSRIVRTQRDLLADLEIDWELLEAFSSATAEPISRYVGDSIPNVQVESRTDVYRPAVVARLTAEQTDALVEAAQGDRRANILQAPSITTFNGQEATLIDCVQQPFVVGVRQREGSLASANEPKIVVIEEGTKIFIRGVQVRGKDLIQLDQRFEMCGVSKVTTAKARLRGEEVTIQIPHVDRCVLNVASEIVSGETLLVGCLPTEGWQQEYMYFLLTAELRDEK